MKLHSLSALACATLMMTVACNTEKNPLLQEWDTPFGIPPFEQVEDRHYLPAFEVAMSEHRAEIEAIVNNPAAPTFENTLVALDRAGSRLNNISAVLGSATNVRSSAALMQIEAELSPKFSAHSSEILMNDQLFERIRQVYDQRASLELDADQQRLLDLTYARFVRSGALLGEAEKARLKEINAALAANELAFEQNVLKETAAYVLEINDPEDLSGLGAGVIADAAARAQAEGKEGAWLFGLDNPSVMPFLQTADNRQLRGEIFEAYIQRANNGNEADNKSVIRALVSLRLEKARLLGYDNYAAYAIDERMAKTPQAVYDLLNQIWTPALAAAKAELKDLQKEARAAGMKEPLSGADWRYYFEKAKQAKFDLSDDQLQPYFQYDAVREGIFYVANQLYGITFRPLSNVPLPHPDAFAYECLDADGSHLGLLFMDMFARPAEKRGGAWCTGYRDQSYDEQGNRVAPLVAIVGNFTRPAGDTPALLTPDEVETFFHEFGHALQALFQDVPYQTLGSVTRDFVELPSQIMEHWAFEPQVLRHYAKHYQTGEVIPDALIEKLDKAGKYGQGFATTELVAAALLDMDYHILTDIPENMDVIAFEKQVMGERGLIDQIPPRYRSTYFRHTFGGGYTAGYYSYIWAEVLDCDAYQAFVETGNIFDPELAASFRANILERVGAEDPMTLYLRFRGAKPGTDALLANRGLN